MDKMDEDIKNCPNPNIKIYVSEHALWPSGSNKGSKYWVSQWYTTHALQGCLATAEWINIMLNRKDVTMMNYHNIHSGAWHMVKRDQNNGKLYTTGIIDMYKMYLNTSGKNIVESQVFGRYCSLKHIDLSFTVAAITGKDKNLYIFLNNFLPVTERNVTFEIKNRPYSLTEAVTLSAPTMKSHNTVYKRAISLTKKSYDSLEEFKQYNIPPKALVRLKLKPLPLKSVKTSAGKNILKPVISSENGWSLWISPKVKQSGGNVVLKNGMVLAEIPDKDKKLGMSSVQLCKNIDIPSLQKYKLDFTVNAEKKGVLRITYLLGKAPFYSYFSREIEITAGEKMYSIEFIPQAANDNYDSPRSLRFFLGHLYGKASINNVSLRKAQ
jgi:hypothetical protein